MSLAMRWRRANQSLSRLLLALWITNFLLMINVFRNPIRVGVDYLYRDLLLTLAMLGLCISLVSQASRESRGDRRLDIALLCTVAFTSGAISLSYPIIHIQTYRQASPYSLPNALKDSDPWIPFLTDSTAVDKGTLFVVDDFFLNRWVETGKGETDWKGLRGFFELRDAGFISVEGAPKIRDATAFTGLTDSLKQSLEPPTAKFCDARLLSFLNVSALLTAPNSTSECVRNIMATKVLTSLQIDVPSLLDDSGMLLTNVSGQQVFQLGNPYSRNEGVTCGLLRDSSCFSTLGIEPSPQWNYDSDNCTLPCLVRLKRTKASRDGSEWLVLPFNSGNALDVQDKNRNSLKTVSVNGLVALQTETSVNEILITAGTDLRMKLHVMTGYLQYLPLLGLVTRIRPRKRNSS